MHSPMLLLSSLALASGAFAQYGSGSGYGSGSSGSGNSASMGSGGSSSMSMAATMAASPASAGTATPSGQVMVHVVKVSNNQGSLTFEPNNLMAAAGSMVQFHFYPKVSAAKQTSSCDHDRH